MKGTTNGNDTEAQKVMASSSPSQGQNLLRDVRHEGRSRGLNDRQIELVSRATPKRQYYLQSARGNRLFELDLGPIALALCGTSDPASQARIDALIAASGSLDFAARFFADVGLEWAIDLFARRSSRDEAAFSSRAR